MLSAVGYEELPWHIDPNKRGLIPRSARRRMSATYQATIPAAIADLSPAVPKATSARIDDLLMRLALVIGRRVSGLIDGVMEDWRSICTPQYHTNLAHVSSFARVAQAWGRPPSQRMNRIANPLIKHCLGRLAVVPMPIGAGLAEGLQK